MFRILMTVMAVVLIPAYAVFHFVPEILAVVGMAVVEIWQTKK